MEYQTFIHTIKSTVSDALSPSIVIQIGIKEMNNGLQQETLVIRDPKFNIAPSILLRPYYGRYQSGMDLDDICDDIIASYYEAAPKNNFNINQFLDYDNAKDHICMRLVNYELNKERLKDYPYIRYLDLAITFSFVLSEHEDQTASIQIHNSHLEHWNVTAETLYEQAKVITPIFFPVQVQSIEEVLEPLPGVPLPDYDYDRCPMLVVSNHQGTYGAVTILYEGILKTIAATLDSDLLVIPSSIHEVIVLPVEETSRPLYINGMIRDINALELQDVDVLSDHAYFYSRKTDSITY